MKNWKITTAYTTTFLYNVEAKTKEEALEKFEREFMLPDDECQSDTELVSVEEDDEDEEDF